MSPIMNAMDSQVRTEKNFALMNSPESQNIIGKSYHLYFRTMLMPVFKLLVVKNENDQRSEPYCIYSIFFGFLPKIFLGLIFVYFYSLEDSD